MDYIGREVWLSREEVASRLAVSKEVVHEWLRSGRLRGVRRSIRTPRVGRGAKTWHVSELEVKRFLWQPREGA